MAGGSNQRSRRVVGRKLATVMAGGQLPHVSSTVTEQELLDLEREAFLGLDRRAKDTGADTAHIEDRKTAAKLTMKIVDRGGGTPIVVIPGAQGRWEWMKPAIDALAQRCRVIRSHWPMNPRPLPASTAARFWCYVDQVRDALDAAGVDRAAICGVSYGGLIAAVFAARYPDRASSLVLVSALPPSWTDRRVQFFLQAPQLLAPLFVISSLRLCTEIAAASHGCKWGPAALRHAWRVVGHMLSPREWQVGFDFLARWTSRRRLPV